MFRRILAKFVRPRGGGQWISFYFAPENLERWERMKQIDESDMSKLLGRMTHLFEVVSDASTKGATLHLRYPDGEETEVVLY